MNLLKFKTFMKDPVKDVFSITDSNRCFFYSNISGVSSAMGIDSSISATSTGITGAIDLLDYLFEIF